MKETKISCYLCGQDAKEGELNAVKKTVSR